MVQEEFERDKAAVDAVVARLAREDADEAEAARRRREAERREMDAQRSAHVEVQRLQAAWQRAEEERCRIAALPEPQSHVSHTPGKALPIVCMSI